MEYLKCAAVTDFYGGHLHYAGYPVTLLRNVGKRTISDVQITATSDFPIMHTVGELKDWLNETQPKGGNWKEIIRAVSAKS
jgi:hypothetical protein